MNKALFNLPVLTTAAFSLAATVVLVSLVFAGEPEGSALMLDEPWAVPDFEVTDHNGQTITRRGMLGRVWVCDFFLTRCNGVCPVLGLKMAATAERLAKDDAFDDVMLVSFSVDPEHDTLDVLQAYRAKNFEFWDKGNEDLRAELDSRWVHARAEDKEAFWQTVRDGFRLGVGPANPEDKTTPIAHSRRFVLVDKEGIIRGVYDAYADEQLVTMIDDIRLLVNE
ncbi:MAG: SCO family protein [Phycisphaeraceae bacterium]|nr:SCO family protein [Phycisphaeraceae bacterium]